MANPATMDSQKVKVRKTGASPVIKNRQVGDDVEAHESEEHTSRQLCVGGKDRT